MKFWDFELDDDQFTDEDRSYLASLSERVLDVEWTWAQLDRVWYSLGRTSRHPSADQQEDAAAFYFHPVWTLNGVFSATDPESQHPRRANASYLSDGGVRDIADYGGVFGQSALLVEASGTARVTFVEPFSSDAVRGRFDDADCVDRVPSLEDAEVEAIIAQDVLEHVDDPIGLAIQVARHVREGGKLIFANRFGPSIECHLPATFHLLLIFPLGHARTGLALLRDRRRRTPRTGLRGGRFPVAPARADCRARLEDRRTADRGSQTCPSRLGQAPTERATGMLRSLRAGSIIG